MAASTPIRLLIADDHPVVRIGLAMIAQTFDDFELVGEAANGAEAVRLCAESHPDVVLIDLKMPDMDGLAATRAIHQAQPEVPVIILTGFADKETFSAAQKAGAVGLLSKDMLSMDDLVQVIRRVYESVRA